MYGWGDIERTVIAAPNPAAGAGFTVPVPGSETQRLLAVSLRLVTDATVGNRNVVVSIVDGSGLTLARTVSGFAQTPSSTADFSFNLGSSEWDSDTATVASGPLFDIPLEDQDSITVSITGVGAADQLSRIRLTLAQLPVRDDDRG